jgi:Tol biopolymer transport system component
MRQNGSKWKWAVRAGACLVLLAALAGSRAAVCAEWVVDNLTQITYGSEEQHGVFNQDGTRIAYRQMNSGYWADCDIWTIDPDGSDAFQVTSSGSGEFDPNFHPDGRVSYVLENGSNDYDIWIANANGTNAHLLIDGPLRQQAHDWKPDGLKIAYTKEYSGDVDEIWLANADGSGQTRLTDHNVDGPHQWGPVYSRSGGKIAYGNGFTTSTSIANVWVMNDDGSGKQQVTFGNTVSAPQFWWPGDTAIGYIRKGTSGRSELWLHYLSTGIEECLLASNFHVEGADLSPDGRTLVLQITSETGCHIWTGNLSQAQAVPEPATISLLALGALGMLIRRRARHK